MRFTLSKMLIAVAMVALACAGLMYHSSGWASVVVTATLVLFGWQVLSSIGRSPQERAFGIGFAIVGCAYLLLVTSPLFGTLRTSLATNYSLAVAARTGAAPDLQLNGYFPGSYTTMAYPTVSPLPSSTFVSSVPRRVIETRMSDDGVPVSEERIVAEQIISASPAVPYSSPAVADEDEDAGDNAADASDEDAATRASDGMSRLRPIPWTSYPAPTTYSSPAYRPSAPPAMPLESIIQMGMSSGNSTPLSQFFLIGHCVWSWLLGLAGGWLAARTITRRPATLPSAA